MSGETDEEAGRRVVRVALAAMQRMEPAEREALLRLPWPVVIRLLSDAVLEEDVEP